MSRWYMMYYVMAVVIATSAGIAAWHINSMALINRPKLLCVLEGNCPQSLTTSPACIKTINAQLQQAKQQGADTALVAAYERELSNPNRFQLKLQQLCELNTIVASADKRQGDTWVFTVITNPAQRDTIRLYYTRQDDNYTMDSITGIADLLLHTAISRTNKQH